MTQVEVLLKCAIFASLLLFTQGAIRDEYAGPEEVVPSPGNNADCTGKEDGIYPNSANCSNFYACSGNVAHVFSCGAGLLFDSESGRCEWAANVKCAHVVPEKVPESEVTAAPESITQAPVTVAQEVPTVEPVTDAVTLAAETTISPNLVTEPPGPVSESTATPPQVAPRPTNRLVFKNITAFDPVKDILVAGGYNGQYNALYVCRARIHPGFTVPGQTDMRNKTCYVPADEDEEIYSEEFTDFEILTNPTNQPLDWKAGKALKYGDFPPNAVPGGEFVATGFYKFYVGRCFVKQENGTSLVPGSISFNAFRFIYEAQVALGYKTFSCKEGYEVLTYA